MKDAARRGDVWTRVKSRGPTSLRAFSFARVRGFASDSQGRSIQKKFTGQLKGDAIKC
jgi:hypothetical protein